MPISWLAKETTAGNRTLEEVKQKRGAMMHLLLCPTCKSFQRQKVNITGDTATITCSRCSTSDRFVLNEDGRWMAPAFMEAMHAFAMARGKEIIRNYHGEDDALYDAEERRQRE